jgi:hypothetical protein
MVLQANQMTGAWSRRDTTHRGRFSEGQEEQAETPEKEQLGRFSEGQELRPKPVRSSEHEGRFSEGQELRGETPEKEHEGRFSDGQEAELGHLGVAA